LSSLSVQQASIEQRPLSYGQNLAQRSPDSIDLVVIHCTELPDLETAREYGQRLLYTQTATGNSGHFYIDRDGRIEQWVDTQRVAHHVKAFNERSIGIELVNLGRYPDWLHTDHQQMKEPYTATQIKSLINLLERLCASHTGLCWYAGHEELDPERVPASNDPARRVLRKVDPGPLFPWDILAKSTSLQPLPLS